MAPRSYLFVPGNRPERFDKAFASGADSVIVDLEDAVPPDQKVATRETVRAWLSAERSTVLRINGADTLWFADDLALCRLPGVAAVMLAKTERIENVAALRDGPPIIALIESALAFENLRAIAGAPNVQRLAFGAIDFQLDMGMRATFDDLVYFRSQLALASRLAGLSSPIDSPSTALDDDEEVASEAVRASRLGFGAKLCIHPRQVGVVNRSFTPTDEELDWARRVLAASARSNGAAVSLDGRMVDRPVVERARMLLERVHGSPTESGPVPDQATGRLQLRIQPVDATNWLNTSARALD
jgi:citrate lyase subunit beta/citryl-CoA lyase